MMKNLEQIRAANALAYAQSGANMGGKEGGDIVKKLPALIMSNGLLAAGAFAYAQKEESGWRECFNHLAKHLAHDDIAVVPRDKNNLDALMDHLAKTADSRTLKMATDEALAWLCYVKRFVRKPAGEEDEE